MATKQKQPQLNSSGMDIPDYAYKAMADVLLPIIQQYYQTEEGRQAFKEWEAKQNKSAH
ncbi:MAG: hypothetical protein FWH42_05800 [Dehalococcoidia bacterium]|nr:hypothetical protein [Dehalococcoidia bacterium]